MTLCMVWRSGDAVHFAADSRLMIASNSPADVGIKVLSVPYRIYSPRNTDKDDERTVHISGELGMCFAGSAINSLTVKESVAEALKEIQFAPGHTDISMQGLANFVFKAYRRISKQVCATSVGEKGICAMVIAGYCSDHKRIRTFLLETSLQNTHDCREILLNPDEHMFVGSGNSIAESALPPRPSYKDYFVVLKKIIDDPSVDTVGGAIQYGMHDGQQFKILGIVELKNGVHYWRGGLDLNSDEFMGQGDALIPGYKYIDPFDTFGK